MQQAPQKKDRGCLASWYENWNCQKDDELATNII
jgi:hypothetical protein